MKMRTSLTAILSFLCLLFLPAIASAHQPRLVSSKSMTADEVVEEPEISKAYYGQLRGAPNTFTIVSDKPFALYVNTLVPYTPGQEKLIVAQIQKDGQTLATLDGATYEWKKFFEPFGHDAYWMGPEYKSAVGPGTYTITVSSPKNDSEYSLAIGETEAFDFQESYNAVRLIPQLKRDFFGKSPIDFILSPFGIGYIVILFVLSFIFGFVYRFVLKQLAKNSVRKASNNIGKSDRLVRALIGVILFIFAICTSWSPALLFFAGFCFFEAIFSWCGFYAAIGKSSCSI